MRSLDMSGPIPRKGSPAHLPDYLQPGLRVLFVGINPGLRSSAVGHHFAGHSNRFWKLLYESRLVPVPLTFREDRRLLEWRLGLTNIIQRPSAGIDALTPQEYAVGKQRLLAIVRRCRPQIVALLGVTICRHLFLDARGQGIRLGLQSAQLADVPLFVLPNPSGRNAHYSYAAMLAAFCALRKEADAL